ncbi:hypothetical protein M422DRAFT_50820 [Sphaerobolus stellatus SS14]|uniref:Uncharacterized protein n=1 Tax=Sphaerobolus stellatus (strain SS14) TaxID=990650 RepID=A0A0C9U1Z3_SPHS4|nr:hypothetical protein M422DRAFT_55251 [Sphaerobolus stellatus SS14]KIJ36818.1 hypothetical protein M422DRAFT_50820 [Sphaerobolus stellatus SS14]
MPAILRTAASGAGKVISQMYGPGGALDSDTGETQFVAGLEAPQSTPPQSPLRSKTNTQAAVPATSHRTLRSPSPQSDFEAEEILAEIDDMLVENSDRHMKLETLKARVARFIGGMKRPAGPATLRQNRDENSSPQAGSPCTKMANGTRTRLGARALKAYAAHKAELDGQEADLLRIKQERRGTPELQPKLVAVFSAHKADLEAQEERWRVIKQELVSEFEIPPVEDKPAISEEDYGDAGESEGDANSEYLVESYHKNAESYYEDLQESYEQRLIDKIWAGCPGDKPFYCSK